MAHAKTLSDTNFRTLIALLEKESRDLARDRAMVLLSMKAGLRAIEIAGLTWGCIREDDTVIELIKTKGGKPRTVPVNKELRAALQAYRAECRRTGDDDCRVQMPPRQARRTDDGERGDELVPRHLRSPPWLDGVLLALRPADVRDTSGAQGNDGRRLAP